MSDLKQLLLQQCLNFVQNRISNAEQAIQSAQQASNDDTKSSAGDKYETSREMMQQETNRNMAQLTEANKLLVALNRISVQGNSAHADAGSVIITTNGNFFLAISAGNIVVNNETYFAVSPGSPIGLKLKGQTAGNEFTLNGKTYTIKAVI